MTDPIVIPVDPEDNPGVKTSDKNNRVGTTPPPADPGVKTSDKNNRVGTTPPPPPADPEA